MTRPPWLRRGLSSVVLFLLLSLAPADNTATPPSMAYRAGVPVSDLWSRRTVGEETGEVKRLRQAEHNIEVLNDRLVDAIRARDRDNLALREKDARLAALTAQLESASANDAKVRAEHEQSVASLKATRFPPSPVCRISCGASSVCSPPAPREPCTEAGDGLSSKSRKRL